MKSKMKWIKSVLICALVLGFMIPQNTYAIDRIDGNRAVSLSINYQGKEHAVSGAEFYIYKVAEVSGFGEFELTEEFRNYPIELEKLDTEGWKVLAETLAAYVVRDQIAPVDSGITNEEGMLYFPSAQTEMSQGLYLVIGEKYSYEQETYTPDPTLICLPNRDVNDEWVYDVTIKPKYITNIEMTELQVVKIWKDNKNEKVRPTKIEVQLLMDGEICDTVELSKENNWRHTWKALEAGHEWKVIEKVVPDGYTVAIDRNQTIYTITNTCTTPSGTSSKLPQTGTLWWPVPILAGLGMIFFMIGWIKRQRSGE